MSNESFRIVISLGWMALLGAGCATTSTDPIAPTVESPPRTVVRYSEVQPEDLIPTEYRVRPGDVLKLSITDTIGPGVETVKTLRVSDSGTISLPLLGQVRVAGLTESEISQLVSKIYHEHLCL
jgi:protein involved in polysaccharide export with SLBB domain